MGFSASGVRPLIQARANLSALDHQLEREHSHLLLMKDAQRGLADIAAGYAGLTMASEVQEVTTVEYKINFLAAFSGGELRARGHVARAGKRLIITTAEVVHLDDDGGESPCALMQQTIAVVQKRY